ncbi:hypothetical protein [Luteolibacter luteus]|uniref:Uncharacterized protein n=1 Tax=Luteolibacter luteus TaxID=2728835 RepID=A0A858RDV3_9BACT|nr:hypothetical protein [Luteolibacter luteus]QJE95266.1 hypothetical protein HHL09_05570 [Luteolibacter luteus]
MAQKAKSINLFAAGDDWRNLLSSVEEQMTIYYVRGGAQNGPPCRMGSHRELEKLGSSDSGNANGDQTYLCVRGDADIEVRGVDQRNGGRMDFVDQKTNFDTVAIKTGGQFESNVLIAGQIGTVSESEWSLRAFAIFQKEVRKRFEKVKSYYVGKEALKLLRDGWRLTANVRSPEAYDLSLS